MEQESLSGSTRNLEYPGAGDRLSSKGGTKGGYAVRGDDDDGPPRTVVKMLKRLMEPSKPKSPPAHRVHTPPAVTDTPRASNEILAVNLTPAGVDRAKQLGIKIDNSGHGSNSSHGKITRLIPPLGMDANQARDLMKDGRSGDAFAVNQHYNFYQPARKDVDEPPSGAVPARHGIGLSCDGDRCFGPKAIHWHKDIQTCASDLRIGIIDTQVDSQHPAFSKAKILIGGFIPDGLKPAPPWHGTGVLSVLAGDADSGTPGLIPQAQFYAASVFFRAKDGQVETDTVSLLSALDWMNAFDVNIVNMSFAGPRDELVEKSIQRMSERGVIFVAAAGNDGPTAAPSYPASYPPVVAVTAVGKELRNYPYANRGDRIDAAAPGVDIWSAVPNGLEGYHTGTSFAAPYVTAILATVYRDLGSKERKDDLLDRLAVLDLGPPGRDPIYGRGLMLAPRTCGDPGAVYAQDAGPREAAVQVFKQGPSLGNAAVVRPSADPRGIR